MKGVEFLIEAYGCDPDRLRSRAAQEELFRGIVAVLQLHPIGEPIFHTFPGAGGVTGLWMLSESHLAVHTFPEYGSLALDVFSCKPRRGDLRRVLLKAVGAREVRETVVERAFAPEPESKPRGGNGHGGS